MHGAGGAPKGAAGAARWVLMARGRAWRAQTASCAAKLLAGMSRALRNTPWGLTGALRQVLRWVHQHCTCLSAKLPTVTADSALPRLCLDKYAESAVLRGQARSTAATESMLGAF